MRRRASRRRLLAATSGLALLASIAGAEPAGAATPTLVSRGHDTKLTPVVERVGGGSVRLRYAGRDYRATVVLAQGVDGSAVGRPGSAWYRARIRVQGRGAGPAFWYADPAFPKLASDPFSFHCAGSRFPVDADVFASDPAQVKRENRTAARALTGAPGRPAPRFAGDVTYWTSWVQDPEFRRPGEGPGRPGCAHRAGPLTLAASFRQARPKTDAPVFDLDVGAGWLALDDFSDVEAAVDAPPPPDRPASPADRCPQIRMIGLRGTTERHASRGGLGTVGGIFGDELARRLGATLAARLVRAGLEYPAAPRSFDMADAGRWLERYRRSVAAGGAALTRLLQHDSTATCYVLIGYSQGAHVLGDVLASGKVGAAVRARIVAAVLLADPRFDPADRSVQRYGSFEPGRSGLFKARRRGAMAKAGPPVLSACNKKDLFCQTDATPALLPLVSAAVPGAAPVAAVVTGAAFKHALDVHGDYRSWARNTAAIVAELVQQKLS